MLFADMQSRGIQVTAQKAGIFLTKGQAREIAETESECLCESGRVSFGGGAAARLMRAFSSSTYLSKDSTVETLKALTQGFYKIRQDLTAQTTDEEIIEELLAQYDGSASGDVRIAVEYARDVLVRRQNSMAYEIVDDDGGRYRWNPSEWHDDVWAQGWDGERWDEDYD